MEWSCGTLKFRVSCLHVDVGTLFTCIRLWQRKQLNLASYFGHRKSEYMNLCICLNGVAATDLPKSKSHVCCGSVLHGRTGCCFSPMAISQSLLCQAAILFCFLPATLGILTHVLSHTNLPYVLDQL